MNPRPVITLLTDFGASDHYAGVMKGVMLGICPEAQLVDISHEMTPYAIAETAFTLAQSWNRFPKGTTHLIVVDPGVGSARRPLVAEAGGHYFVAPDNGVLTMLFESVAAHEVREIMAERFFLQPVSQTFHGRDIFAPVAAHLASGIPPSEFGPPIRDYRRLDIAKPVPAGTNRWTGTILKIDRFGNLITNLPSDMWLGLASGPFSLAVGDSVISAVAYSYAEAPSDDLFVIRGSAGYLEVSINRDNARLRTGASPGSPISIQIGVVDVLKTS